MVRPPLPVSLLPVSDADPFLGVMLRVFSRAIKLRMDRSSFWALVSSCSRFSSLLLLLIGMGEDTLKEDKIYSL